VGRAVAAGDPVEVAGVEGAVEDGECLGDTALPCSRRPTAGSSQVAARVRGLGAAHDELNLIALTHNLLKLFRFGVRPALTLAA